MTSAGGVPLTWSDNGNLLADGTSTYQWDHANRLIGVTQGASGYVFSYNALGDRLRQTVNGVPTNYTLDLESGLTQVLSDGTTAFLYGNRRLAEEQPGGWAYHLPDALGSVRQLADADGDVTLAHAFEPYGESLASSGAGDSAYGYTGEWTDGTGLVHLRARYYAPYLKQWTQPDPIVPDPRMPADWNRYAYVRNNPVNYADPTGLIAEDEAEPAWDVVMEMRPYRVGVVVDWGYMENGVLRALLPISPELAKEYGWGCLEWSTGRWSLNELYILKGAVQNMDEAMNGKMGRLIGPVTISKVAQTCGRGCTWGGDIELLDRGQLPALDPGPSLSRYYDVYRSVNFDQWTIVHEMAHAWNNRSHGWLSRRLVVFTGGGWGPAWDCDEDWLPGCNRALYRYGDIPAAGSDINFNAREDFSESVAAYVFPQKAQQTVKERYGGDPDSLIYRHLYYPDYTQTRRWAFVDSLINGDAP